MTSASSDTRERIDIGRMTEGLTVGDDGIWRSTSTSAVSYPAGGHSACLAVEAGSFWFNHRNDCIRALVNTFPPDASRPVLDVGGGNGYVSLGLERAGIDVILVEPGESGARNAKQRGLEHVICATASEANFRPGSIGGIGLFDVIEHVEDDHGFLDRLSSHLVRNDRLYATVPAYQALWSDEDVKAGHQRRYDARTATALLEATGFEVDFTSYFFRPLPVPVLLFRTLPSRLRGRRPPSAETEAVPSTPDDVEPEPSAAPARSHAANAGTLSRAVRRLLRSEIANIESGRPMRFGGSIILAAHRR